MRLTLSEKNFQDIGIPASALKKYGRKVDLHVHSSKEFSPQLLVEAAEQLNLRAIGVFDYFDVSANQIARRYAQEHQLRIKVLGATEVVPSGNLLEGWADIDNQLDLVFSGNTEKIKQTRNSRKFMLFDLLAYNLKENDPSFSRMEEETLNIRRNRVLSVIEKINEGLQNTANQSFPLELEDITDSWDEMGVYKALSNRNLQNTEMKVYIKQLFSEAYEAFPPFFPSIASAINFFSRAGAMTFLAHPFIIPRVEGLIGADKENTDPEKRWETLAKGYIQQQAFFRSLIEEMMVRFKSLGGKGIEVLHPHHLRLPGSKKMITELAREHELMICGGSDFSRRVPKGYYSSDSKPIGIVDPSEFSDENTLGWEEVSGWIL